MRDLIGKVVYFIEHGKLGYQIRYGLVTDADTHWEHHIIDFLVLREHRYVKSVPIQEFSDTPWRKIPKEWRDEPWKIETGETCHLRQWEKDALSISKVDDPNSIKDLYDKGILVTKNKIINWRVESELNRNKEYRIVRKIPVWTLTYGEDKRTYTSLPDNEVFESYAEAQKRLEEIKEALRAEAALSDEEWSIKEIDKVLGYFDNKELVRKWRKKLLSMDHIEEIEIKKVNDTTLWWRYFSPRTVWQELLV